jgi:pilus assembly protein CpaB
MIGRFMVFIMMALGLAGFGTVAWIATRPPTPQVQAKDVPKSVLAAAHSLRAGGLIKPGDLAGGQRVITTSEQTEVILDTPDARRDLLGAMVRRPLAEGDTIRNSDVIRTGDHGFLAAALQPGMRAVSISIDAASGTGSLIWPGDRVDLVLTQSISDQNVPAGRRVAADTVLSNIRVLAIDQQLVRDATAATSTDNKSRSVTLEVTEEQAQRISVALQLGHLSLSVRAADQASPVPGTAVDPSTVWAFDVSPALGRDKAPPVQTGTMRIFSGSTEPKEFKF